MRIAIIGAGVAGGVLARGLAELPGIETHCLERIQAGEHAEAGTGLNLGPNAVRALRATDPVLAAEIDAASYPWESWRCSTMGGRDLFHFHLRDIGPEPGWRLRWSELYRVLRDGAGEAIRYGCVIDAVTPKDDGAGRFDISFHDAAGARVLRDVDLLIAADGRFSRVRETFQGALKARQIGVAIFRLLVDDTTGGLIDDYQQWFNGNARLLGYRVPPGKIYMSGTFPIAVGAEIPDEMKTRAALRRAFTPRQGALSPQGRWLVDLIADPEVELHWARLQESPLCLREPGRNVLYIGDSSNGMVPTLGQGATQAMESACVALELIRGFVAAGDYDAPRWLKTIVAARRERLRFVMDFSLEATDTMLPGSDSTTGSLRKTEPAFQRKLSRLYNDVSIPAALKGAPPAR